MMRDKILLVEDDPDYRETLVEKLTYEGVPPEQILCAHDAASAKKAWDDHKDQIGVVLTDGCYPGGDAFPVIRHIRRDDENMPVILISAGAEAWRKEISERAVKYPEFLNVPVIYKACSTKCGCGKCGPEGQDGFLSLVLGKLADQAAAKPGSSGNKANLNKVEPT